MSVLIRYTLAALAFGVSALGVFLFRGGAGSLVKRRTPKVGARPRAGKTHSLGVATGDGAPGTP